MLCVLGFPVKQQERAGQKAALLKRHPGSCRKVVTASQNGNKYQTNKNRLQNLGKSKKCQAVGGDVKSGFQTMAVQSPASGLTAGWDRLNITSCFVGFSLQGCAREAGSVLAGSHQSSPVSSLTSTRRPSSLFVCRLPALHLTGLSHCKMGKNCSGVIVEHVRRSASPLCTSSFAGREKGGLKRREMGLP